MIKYVGIRDNKISVVSDLPFQAKGMKVVESFLDDPMKAAFKKVPQKSLSDMRVAFVGNWKMVCGISTYSEKLWPHMIKLIGGSRLFVEKVSEPTGLLAQVGDQILPEEDVVQCWARGESLRELADRIDEYDPDIVFIQHEFGLWPNARHWLAFIGRMSSRRVIVTMHSVFYHRDKTVCEAVIPEIVVHLDGAKNVLSNSKKVAGKVIVIPHGCDQNVDPAKLWNIYRSPRTFLQAGFGFHYKGWETSLRATAILQKKYSDVFFTGIFSESPFNRTLHEVYYHDLMKMVKNLGIEENVSIVRGFQSDEVLDSFFRTNQAAVFPYVSTEQHEVFGASGAARMAMSKGIPVVTSRVNHFSDLPTIKITNEFELAEELEKLFNDWKYKRRQIDIQMNFIQENSWELVAKKYLELFLNIEG